MELKEAINRTLVNEISGGLKGRYLKQAIEDLEWFATASEYNGLDDAGQKKWDKRRANVMKLVDQLTAKK